ncbi:MAG: fused MFS/spermidine synthase, partial [Blastococcus sp.]|nr:fused MFS/spermidine synthase [Blastococcus sp.]
MRTPPGPVPVTGGTAELLADADRDGSWVLMVDGTPQSHVDLEDPTHLEFEYVRRMGHVIDLAATPGAALDVVHLGGGALTLPRYVATTRPGSRQRAVELDQPLTDLVREYLPLPRNARIRVRAGDAREALATLHPSSADVVVTDVFAGARTPAHLTTLEFAREVARVLRPGGVYAANVADG